VAEVFIVQTHNDRKHRQRDIPQIEDRYVTSLFPLRCAAYIAILGLTGLGSAHEITCLWLLTKLPRPDYRHQSTSNVTTTIHDRGEDELEEDRAKAIIPGDFL
jgi:hypothetical protein